LGAGCSREQVSTEQLGSVQSAVVAPVDIKVSVASGTTLTATVLASQEGMVFGAGSQITKDSLDPGPHISALGGTVRAEPDARLTELWSRGAVELRDRARVLGPLHAATVVLGNGAVVEGAIDRAPQLDPPQMLEWQVGFPAGPAENYSLEPDRQGSIQPAKYGTIRVASRSTLTLRSGVYYVERLELEPQSRLVLDQGAGPVIIYVSTYLQPRGELKSNKPGEAPDLALIYLGSSDVYLEAPFYGALVAPKAALTLRQTQAPHEGFFFAKSINVDANARVKHVPPLSLFVASGTHDLDECARSIVPRRNLTGAARERAYQNDIARYCSMRGANPCQIDLTSRVNLDYTAAAASLVGEQTTPAQYLALVRDRTRKLRAAEDDAALAQAICTKVDADDDLVPDSDDQCLGTPPLTPTLSNGCPDTALPEAPAPEDVKKALDNSAIVFSPQCSGAAPLEKVPAGGFYYPGNRPLGTFILAGRVANQPPNCLVLYYFDVEELDSSGAVVNRYMTAFRANEEAPALIGTSAPVPAGYVQFNPKPGDAGSRGRLGNAGGTNIRYRVMTMNGIGARGGWSDWKFTTNEDCLALGFKCGG
jgi:hypothetical protein